jgi:hypothetical protein
MSKNTNNYRVSSCFLVICMVFLFAGCAEKSSSSQDDLPLLANTVGTYSDIELPSDMQRDSRYSVSMNNNSFSGGILKYSGRVEVNSLKEFIIASMKKHQWRLAGEASYGETLLAFVKPNKSCMAVISEGFGGSYGYTYVSLYVTFDKTSGKGTSSYDEPVQTRGIN